MFMFLVLATACKGEICGVDLTDPKGNKGCCVNIDTCDAAAGDCVTTSANYAVGVGNVYPANDAVCYQSDCLNIFPASCAVIDRTLSPCKDNGQLCSDAFPARKITPGKLP